MKVQNVVYNPQTDNTPGKYDHQTRIVDGNSQCGYAMFAHVAQPLFPEMASDLNVAKYVADLENDQPGSIGMRVRALVYNPNPAVFIPRLGAQIDAHSNALRLKLADAGRTDIDVVQHTGVGTPEDIIKALEGGSPVGCMAVFKVAGFGLVYHFETIVGYEKDASGNLSWIMYDSYGNFYPQWNPASYGKGADILYPEPWFRQQCGGYGYIWYWRKK